MSMYTVGAKTHDDRDYEVVGVGAEGRQVSALEEMGRFLGWVVGVPFVVWLATRK